MGRELDTFLEDILCGGEHYLGGIHNRSNSLSSLLTAVVQWAETVGKSLDEVVAGIEPCIRQSVLMSLIPADALDPAFQGSIDLAVDEHLRRLGIEITDEGRLTLRDVCINARRLYGLTRDEARNMTASIAQLRGDPSLYGRILSRQQGRCIWCGVLFADSFVVETLDHVTPKHLGDDHVDGRNWALACASCNHGKGDSFAWSARAEAHDFMGRNDILAQGIIGLKHRWSVLMRGRCCEHCRLTTEKVELWVYRRVRTGLPLPVNCGAVCTDCARSQRSEILVPIWAAPERNRAVLTV